MEAAIVSHRNVSFHRASILQQLPDPPPTTSSSFTPPNSGSWKRCPSGPWSQVPLRNHNLQCLGGPGQSRANPERFLCREALGGGQGLGGVSEPGFGTGVQASERNERPKGLEKLQSSATILSPENVLLEEELEAGVSNSAADNEAPGHQNSSSRTQGFLNPDPANDLDETPSSADSILNNATDSTPSKEEASGQPWSKQIVYIVDIMPICFRGRGRGKLEPKACLEWMEALVGISKDSPIIGVLDGEDGNAWRRELYPDYKSGRNLYRPFPTIGHRRNRHRVHINPFETMPVLEPLFRLLNIPIVKIHDAEADDVIATLAQQAVDLGHRVNIVSPDTDLRQLLGEKISIWAPRAELMPQFNFFDGRKFEERVGYPPEKFVLLRCLLGDQSDAIRGLPHYVPEFGRNSAIKLIEKFGSVADLLDAARTRTIGRSYMQEAVLTYAKVLELNETLITLKRDVAGVSLDPSWLLPRDRTTEGRAYHVTRVEIGAMKKAGKMLLVRPSPDADRKLSGVPIPPKVRKPRDLSPKWPPGFQDYKGLLQTACERAKCPVPKYALETEGLSHEPLHRATVSVGGEDVTGPYESLKKRAEHAAAKTAWETLLQAQNGTGEWPLEQQGEAVQRALYEKIYGGTIIRLLEEQLQAH